MTELVAARHACSVASCDRGTSNPRSPLPRLALSPDEAAATLGVSRDYFDEHIRPELRLIRRGRRVLISIRELERWLETSAARTLGAA